MKYFANNLTFLRTKLGKSQNEIAAALSFSSRSRYANYEAGHSYPDVETLITLGQYFNVNIDDLLSKDLSKSTNLSKASAIESAHEMKGAIPLVNSEAFAGINNGVFKIQEKDIQAYYVVPDFKNITFMMRVRGDSMYPKYKAGDVIACRVINHETFIQWNKVHVIASKDQGILIKRIRKSNNPDNLVCVSDNKEYEPFEIPINETDGIALVIGLIRLE